MISKINFTPFVGNEYFKQSSKILILGESHYRQEKFGTEREYTINVVKRLGKRINGERHAFFTKIAKILSRKPYANLSNMDAQAFWETVAFYNYVQSFVGTKPKERPTPKMFEDSQYAMKEILFSLKPDIIVVLGVELYKNLVRMNIDFGDAMICSWTHPSSPHFKREDAIATFGDIYEAKVLTKDYKFV